VDEEVEGPFSLVGSESCGDHGTGKNDFVPHSCSLVSAGKSGSVFGKDHGHPRAVTMRVIPGNVDGVLVGSENVVLVWVWGYELENGRMPILGTVDVATHTGGYVG